MPLARQYSLTASWSSSLLSAILMGRNSVEPNGADRKATPIGASINPPSRPGDSSTRRVASVPPHWQNKRPRALFHNGERHVSSCEERCARYSGVGGLRTSGG